MARSTAERVADLLSQWERLRQQGQEVLPEQLCADCPDLLPEVQQRIYALNEMGRSLLLPTREGGPGQSASEADPADPWATRPTVEPARLSHGSSAEVPAGAAPAGFPTLPGYEVLAELGQGGMGVVYKALDRAHQRVVALKTMRQLTPEALYRFKREFRARANLTHPNLVPLYELVSDGRQWFFTMELVEGVDFLTYLRNPASVVGPTAGQERRLRQAFRQLAEGILALHADGKLHRDLKPGNVLVTPSGRVVLLDFGLVADVEPVGLPDSLEGRLVGTVPYMAPEQAACQPLTEASDWYSVGVMLYQALTGQLPFRGELLRVLQDKQLKDSPHPRR